MATSILPPKPQASQKTTIREAPPLTVSRRELLIDGSDREFRIFVHGMLSFAERLEAVRGGFAGLLGLTGIQYTILMAIKYLKRDGEVSVRKVADHLHLSGAYVTIETGKLLKTRLLLKQPDPKDQRRVRLSITEKGRNLLTSLAPVQAAVNDVLFEFLSASDFRRLRSAVDAMAACGDRAVSLLHHLERIQGGRMRGALLTKT